MEARKCPKCNGTGVVKDSKGTHTCWDCLENGELNVHTKNIPDSRIKI